MVASKDDETGMLTLLGSFTGQLAMGINLSRLVYYSILLDIPAEGVVIAAALSLAKSPYRQAIPLIHTDPIEYNEIVRIITLSQLKYDGGLYSQPIMYLQLYADWTNNVTKLSMYKQNQWCVANGLVFSRVKQFDSLVRSTCRRVTNLLSDRDKVQDSLLIGGGSSDSDTKYVLTNSIINKIRLLLMWTSFKENLISILPTKDEVGVGNGPVQAQQTKQKHPADKTAKADNSAVVVDLSEKTPGNNAKHFESLFTDSYATTNSFRNGSGGSSSSSSSSSGNTSRNKEKEQKDETSQKKADSNSSSSSSSSNSNSSSTEVVSAGNGVHVNGTDINLNYEVTTECNMFYTAKLSPNRMHLAGQILNFSVDASNMISVSMLLFAMISEMMYSVVLASTEVSPFVCPFVWATEKFGNSRNMLIAVRGTTPGNDGISALFSIVGMNNSSLAPGMMPTGMISLDANYLQSICERVDAVLNNANSKNPDKVKRNNNCAYYLVTNVNKSLYKKIVAVLEAWHCRISQGNGILLSLDIADNAVVTLKNCSEGAAASALFSRLSDTQTKSSCLSCLFFANDTATAIAVQNDQKQKVSFTLKSSDPMSTTHTPLLSAGPASKNFDGTFSTPLSRINHLGLQLLRSARSGYRDK